MRGREGGRKSYGWKQTHRLTIFYIPDDVVDEEASLLRNCTFLNLLDAIISPCLCSLVGVDRNSVPTGSTLFQLGADHESRIRECVSHLLYFSTLVHPLHDSNPPSPLLFLFSLPPRLHGNNQNANTGQNEDD